MEALRLPLILQADLHIFFADIRKKEFRQMTDYTAPEFLLSYIFFKVLFVLIFMLEKNKGGYV